MTAPPLQLRSVAFAYPETPVFENLSVEIRAGDFAAVLGPNGCGKTTLLRLATRVLPADAGTVLLLGDDVRSLTRREIARRVAVVPQMERALFPFRAVEAVLMGRTPWTPGFGFESPDDLRIAMECLRAVDAESLAERDLTVLSGGELQRVLLARALAQETGLLVLDEPTSHLDLRHQVEILRLLRRLRESKGLTVVVISHDVNLAARFAERLLLVGSGGVVADGPPAEVLRPEVLSAVYRTRVSVRSVEGLDTPHVFPE